MRRRLAQALIGLGVLLAAGLILAGNLWKVYWVPAGSMLPTLRVGDEFAARRGAGVMPLSRGEVVVIARPGGGPLVVKRVIGLAGDRVQMKAGALWLNGAPVPEVPDGIFRETFAPGPSGERPHCANAPPVPPGGACDNPRLTETLPGGPSYSILATARGAPGADTPELTVPPGHVFLLGDNRASSLDSRFPLPLGPGPVPAANAIARADLVLFNWSGAPGRLLRRIR